MLMRHDPLTAEHAFLRAIELDPHNEMAEMWLGNALGAQGRLLDAHMHYARAYELQPTHPTINQNYVNSLMLVGDYSRVEAVLDRFASPTPNPMIEELKAMFALDTGRLMLAEETAAALDRMGKARAAALIRWQISRQQGDWVAAGEWLGAAHKGRHRRRRLPCTAGVPGTAVRPAGRRVAARRTDPPQLRNSPYRQSRGRGSAASYAAISVAAPTCYGVPLTGSATTRHTTRRFG